MPAVATGGGLPTRLGKYELMMPLAAGGMARIDLGRSTGIGSFERHVVLKLITPERANDHTAVQMFLDEARLAASLNHQNVAQVFEVGEDSGVHYLAMEYVHGQDLRALLAKAGSQGTRVPLELALTVVTGAAAGLEHAHDRRGPDGVPLGIVHRDVSPSNIMIGYDGSVKLLDFGIAKATARSVETQSGIIKGKFAYMAPEQCRGRDVDRRSDVFSLGIILYEITTQHRCFRADSDFDTMHRIVTGDVVRPTRLIQGYPQALEAIVMKALAVDANQRYQSAGLLLEAVEAFAISSRMGLSTMSLGRFMRDMFGDQQEPWLMQSGRLPAPVQPKESTISNTNGNGTPPPIATPREPPVVAAHEQAPLRLQSEPNAANDTADDDDDAGADDHAAWNAKSFPTMHPGDAPHAVRSSSPQLPVAATRRSSPQLNAIQPLATPVRGSQPIPAGQFAQAGSGSSPSHPPIATTLNGYASGSSQTTGPSYPSAGALERYQPPSDVDGMVLRPNRRPLFIGLGLAAAGLIVLLAVTLGGSDGDNERPVVMSPRDDEPVATETRPTTPTTPSPVPANAPDELGAPPKKDPAPPKKDKKAGDPPSRAVATPEDQTPETGHDDAIANAAPVVPGGPEAADLSIAFEINSSPENADVLLAGKVIGTTPLKTTIPRGPGPALLTVHKANYVDVTREIDLRDDVSVELALRKDEPKDVTPPKRPVTKTQKVTRPSPPEKEKKPAPPEKKPNATPPPDKDKKPAPTSPPEKDKKPAACQPPGQVDPFDTRPVCK